MSSQPLDIGRLSPEEQLQLIEQLWENLSRNPERIPLTEAQRQELDRRIEEAEAPGGGGIPWEEVLRRIRACRR